MQLIYAANAN